MSRRCPVHSLTALRPHLTHILSHSHSLPSHCWIARDDGPALGQESQTPPPTPPSPRPPSGRWPCPPSAGNQSILAADMLAGCPLRSMRGADGLGLRLTLRARASKQAAASSLEESTGPMVEGALIQPVVTTFYRRIKSSIFAQIMIGKSEFERWGGKLPG